MNGWPDDQACQRAESIFSLNGDSPSTCQWMMQSLQWSYRCWERLAEAELLKESRPKKKRGRKKRRPVQRIEVRG